MTPPMTIVALEKDIFRNRERTLRGHWTDCWHFWNRRQSESSIAPENGWLEYYFPFGFRPIFRCKLLVSGSVFCLFNLLFSPSNLASGKTSGKSDVSLPGLWRSSFLAWQKKRRLKRWFHRVFNRSGQITLPETNIALENRPLEKEIPIGNHHFYGLC